VSLDLAHRVFAWRFRFLPFTGRSVRSYLRQRGLSIDAEISKRTARRRGAPKYGPIEAADPVPFSRVSREVAALNGPRSVRLACAYHRQGFKWALKPADGYPHATGRPEQAARQWGVTRRITSACSVIICNLDFIIARRVAAPCTGHAPTRISALRIARVDNLSNPIRATAVLVATISQCECRPLVCARVKSEPTPSSDSKGSFSSKRA
jgi:hypothetical protein